MRGAARFLALLVPLALLALGAPALAEVPLRLAPVFTDGMVLQRARPIPVWGRAEPGAEVAARLGDDVARDVADDAGRWRVELPAHDAGGPHTLEVVCGAESRVLEDVLVGEVWLCSGQSNMRFELRRATTAVQALAEAEIPRLRLFDMRGGAVPDAGTWSPAELARGNVDDYYDEARWRASTPETAAGFSAVAWFFGRRLSHELDVPVGLVHNAIGGSCIESWIGAEGLDSPEVPEWCRARMRENLAGWTDASGGARPRHPFEPAFLFEAGVAPLAPFPFRGVLWYQGESNAASADGREPLDPERARAGIRALVADWRRAFEDPELPFLMVQLPGSNRSWMEFRQVQLECAEELDGVELAVTIDVGHPTDVHPRRKRPVGERLALLAEERVHGRDVAGRSPVPARAIAGRGEMIVEFDAPITTRDGGAPRGFELAGADGRWFPAAAFTLDSDPDVVILQAPRIPAPIAYRHGWEPDPDLDLVGRSGLPVPPFRAGSLDFTGPDALYATSFEAAPARWTLPAGQAEIDDAHRRTGRRCLHVLGGEASEATLELPSAEAGAVSFWVERWTRRDPFEFLLSARVDGEWQPPIDLSDRALVGGFLAEIRIALPDGCEALRWSCRAPAGTGVLIDDLRVERAGPKELVAAWIERPTLPALAGTAGNPVARLVLEVRGTTGELALTGLDVTTAGTTDLADVRRVAVLGADERPFGQAAAPAERLTFAGRAALAPGENEFWIAFDLAPGANIDHRLQAAVPRVRLSDGRELPPLEARPGRGQRIGLALRTAGDDGAAAYRIPGLVTTNAGTLIAVYDVRWNGWGDLPGNIDVGMSRSTDGGRTWAPMRIVLDMGDDPAFAHDGVGDPAVLVDRETGSVWIAATWSHGNRAWRGSGPGLAPDETGQLVLVESTDDGLTWSAPRNVTAQVKDPAWAYVLAGPGRGITMADGTLVFAAQFQDSPENGRTPHATVMTSRDHGATWRIGAPAKTNTTEAQVVELEPGTLMLNMRDNRGGARSVATSTDLGATWREHPTSRVALPEPVCMASLIRAGVGDWLLFSNPAVDAPPRRRMTIQASPDAGTTWPARTRTLIDEGPSPGYSCLTMIDTETVGVLFEGSRAHLTFLRVPLAELAR